MARRDNVVILRELQRKRLNAAYAETPVAGQYKYDAAFLRGEFASVALIAAIPPENVDAFLQELADYVYTFEYVLGADRLIHERRIAINEFLTASGRMIRAIEHVQKYNKKVVQETAGMVFEQETADMVFDFHLRGPSYKSKRPSLADLKRELAALHDNAKAFSVAELPKRGENRTKILLKNIWATAEKFGGGLSYDKKSGRGTLSEVIAFFDSMGGWANLSPSTLDRLRPR